MYSTFLIAFVHTVFDFCLFFLFLILLCSFGFYFSSSFLFPFVLFGLSSMFLFLLYTFLFFLFSYALKCFSLKEKLKKKKNPFRSCFVSFFLILPTARTCVVKMEYRRKVIRHSTDVQRPYGQDSRRSSSSREMMIHADHCPLLSSLSLRVCVCLKLFTSYSWIPCRCAFEIGGK